MKEGVMKTYIIVRTIGLTTRLLTLEDYIALIRKVRSLYELGYREAEGVSIEDYSKIRKVAAKTFISRLRFLASLKSPYTSFIEAYLARLEAENIKIRIREIYSKKLFREYYYPYEKSIPLRKIQEARKIEDLIKVLGETVYQKYLEQLFKSAEKPSREQLELAVDSAYYYYLKQTAMKCRASKHMIAVLDVEGLTRLAYWLIILKEEAMQLKEAEILNGFKPIEAKVVGWLELESIAETLGANIHELRELMSRNKITEAILLVEKSFVNKLEKYKRLYKMTDLIIVYYMIRSRIEMENLERISLGEKYKIPFEELIDYVVAPTV